MKHRLKYLLVGALMLTASTSFAQRDKEDRKEEQAERHSANDLRVDCAVFRRQILALPEFAEQRRKIAELRKEGKGICKIYAVVDSNSDNEDENLLSGYIQMMNKNGEVNVYELTYDRKRKKITNVKPTGESLEFDEEEVPATKGPKQKPPKKMGEDEEGEEED